MPWSGHQQPNTYRIPTSVYCRCGSYFPLRSAEQFDPEHAPAVQKFRAVHTGPTCGIATAAEATQARRRERRAQQRQEVRR